MTDATRHGLFRRLRRATSRGPLAPGHTSSTQGQPDAYLSTGRPVDLPDTELRLNVDDIVEAVWVLELDVQD